MIYPEFTVPYLAVSEIAVSVGAHVSFCGRNQSMLDLLDKHVRHGWHFDFLHNLKYADTSSLSNLAKP